MDNQERQWTSPIVYAHQDVRNGLGRVVVFQHEDGREIAYEIDEADFINLHRKENGDYPDHRD